MEDWEKKRLIDESNSKIDEHNRLIDEGNRAREEHYRKIEAQSEELLRLEKNRIRETADREQEKEYKDKILDLKKRWAESNDTSQQQRYQILIAEAEQEYNDYLVEKERIRQIEDEKRQQSLKQYEQKLQKIKEEKQQTVKIERRKSFIKRVIIGSVFLIFLVIALTTWKSNKLSSKSVRDQASSMSSNASSLSKKDSKIDKTKNNSAPSVTNQKTFTMENYVGQTKSAAVENLKANYNISEKLIKIVEEESNEYETGQVIRQSPTAGSTYDLTSNRQIVLTVAKEVSSVAMPDFGSMQYTYANARSYLIQMGVSSSRIERVVDQKVTSTQADLVTSQSPAAGKTIDLKSNEKISLYVTEATTPSSSSSSSSSSGSKNSSSSDDENHSSSSSSSEH